MGWVETKTFKAKEEIKREMKKRVCCFVFFIYFSIFVFGQFYFSNIIFFFIF